MTTGRWQERIVFSLSGVLVTGICLLSLLAGCAHHERAPAVKDAAGPGQKATANPRPAATKAEIPATEGGKTAAPAPKASAQPARGNEKQSPAGGPTAKASEEKAPFAEKSPLEMELRQALILSLKNQGKVAVARFEPQINETGIDSAKAPFDPTLFADGTYTKENRPTGTRLDSGLPTFKQKTVDATVGLREKLPFGTDLEISGRRARIENNSQFAIVQPQQVTNFALKLKQAIPFIGRGFSYAANMYGVYIARANYGISLQNFRRTVLDTASQTAQTYWLLHYRDADLGVQRDSLRLSQKLLEDERRRLQTGLGSKLSVAQAERQVASDQQAVLEAQADLERATDQLKLLLNMPDDTLRLDIVIRPVNGATAPQKALDQDQAIATAIYLRPELVSKREELAARKVVVKYADDQKLPIVDLTASLGYNGLTKEAEKSIEQVSDGKFPTWSTGVSIEVPIGNRAARSAYKKARLEEEQSLVDLKSMEQQIIIEVRDAVRTALTAEKKIIAAQVEVRAAEEALRVQETRRDAGQSKTYDVLEAQRDLKSSRTKELQARVEHLSALAKLSTATTEILEENGIALLDGILSEADANARKKSVDPTEPLPSEKPWPLK